MTMSVGSIHRYPVKSMRGEPLDACAIGARGLDGDRRYAIVDAASGRVASAKHPRAWGALLDARAETDGGDVWIELPRERVRARDAGPAIARWLGRDVRIADTPPADPRGDKDGGSYALAQGAPGTFFDFAPVHLVTTASLASLGGVDPRRFRPNLVIRTEAAGFPEDAWVGRTLAIGGARLRVIVVTPRCVIPTLAHGALAADPPLLRAIARAHTREVLGQAQPCAGAYAIVEQPGAVAAGDEVRVS